MCLRVARKMSNAVLLVSCNVSREITINDVQGSYRFQVRSDSLTIDIEKVGAL